MAQFTNQVEMPLHLRRYRNRAHIFATLWNTDRSFYVITLTSVQIQK